MTALELRRTIIHRVKYLNNEVYRVNIKLFGILDFYIKRNGSMKFPTKLYRRFKKELSLIDKNPDIGIKTDFETIRGLIIDDFILFYELTPTSHAIWDYRQNADDFKHTYIHL